MRKRVRLCDYCHPSGCIYLKKEASVIEKASVPFIQFVKDITSDDIKDRSPSKGRRSSSSIAEEVTPLHYEGGNSLPGAKGNLCTNPLAKKRGDPQSLVLEGK